MRLVLLLGSQDFVGGVVPEKRQVDFLTLIIPGRLAYSPDALVRLTLNRSRRRWYLRVISALAWPSCFCT